MTETFRVFIDANVLFSASYADNHSFLIFWTSTRVHPVTSTYVADETRRNARTPGHQNRLDLLLRTTEVIADLGEPLPEGVSLPEKDQPILSGAIAARARYLVTGDKNHFGSYFDQTFATAYGLMTIVQPVVLRELLKSLE